MTPDNLSNSEDIRVWKAERVKVYPFLHQYVDFGEDTRGMTSFAVPQQARLAQIPLDTTDAIVGRHADVGRSVLYRLLPELQADKEKSDILNQQVEFTILAGLEAGDDALHFVSEILDVWNDAAHLWDEREYESILANPQKRKELEDAIGEFIWAGIELGDAYKRMEVPSYENPLERFLARKGYGPYNPLADR